MGTPRLATKTRETRTVRALRRLTGHAVLVPIQLVVLRVPGGADVRLSALQAVPVLLLVLVRSRALGDAVLVHRVHRGAVLERMWLRGRLRGHRHHDETCGYQTQQPNLLDLAQRCSSSRACKEQTRHVAEDDAGPGAICATERALDRLVT